uniref:tripartite motif-containing protein 10-like n=1 Tax=Euleptes europaea TaxID=460621 RepID=UPI0025402F0F|nr:tripartite motif-containing protein 10-like [Euleptes europaea]
MASASPFTDVQNEITCPICLECLTDPVVLDCGHSFCQVCITNYCEKWDALGSLKCPVCEFKFQKGDFRPNWMLGNVAEKIKLLALNIVEGFHGQEPMLALSSGQGDICSRHKEKLHLFCEEDEKLVCFVCKRSPEHKGHKIYLLEEAAQQYKDQIRGYLETVKNERKKILAYKADAEKESQDMLKTTKLKREKIVAHFERLHKFLLYQERLTLFQLEELEKEIASKKDEHLARLSEELASHESLIQEMEEKHQQQAIKVLQDVRRTLQRYKTKEKFDNPEAFPSELKWRLQGCCEINPFLEGIIKKFPESLVSGLPMQRAKVTLDPASANTHLFLHEDQRTMTWQSTTQELSEYPEKGYGFVLGCEGFTAGCHFWEAVVGSGEGWAVGVARKPVMGRITLTPEEGIWAVWRWKGRYKASIKGIDPPLTLSGKLKRIRVCLNYDGGQVAFFDAKRAALLYAFSEASFSGETLHPFFAVYDKGYLKLLS